MKADALGERPTGLTTLDKRPACKVAMGARQVPAEKAGLRPYTNDVDVVNVGPDGCSGQVPLPRRPKVEPVLSIARDVARQPTALSA